jgi:two-component system chemotaxis response regulator CheY
MPKKILVVDDSAMMRKIIIKSMRESGFDVDPLEAGDGIEAMKIFAAGGIHAVFTDWNMPNMDGLALVKEIRKSERETKVPIVMITTEVTPDKVKEAVLAGATNYIGKPFTTEKLKEKFAKYLS